MNIDSIRNGYVIDHIQAGTAMKLYELLDLEKLDCGIAIIKNAQSDKSGKKDIIKIDALIDLDLDMLGYIDPGITLNVVKDGEIIEKRKLTLPDELTGVISCKNPRCITSVEQELPQRFKLTDTENGVYRCIYCETKVERG